jgi:vanillate O-demethylase ferredoxin subunit
MTINSEPMLLQVLQAQTLNPLVRMFHLARADGGVLPGYTAGAHIQVQVKLPDGTSDWRAYSLINFATSAEATAAPTQYCIAVRRDDAGRGGSRWMHEQLQAGTMLAVQTPRNDFPLKDCAGTTVLLAGGIGVTPLAAMAAQCRAQGRPVRLHYAGRSRSLMAFLPELQALLGDRLQLHIDDEAAGLDIAALLAACAPQDKLYLCGPQPMLDAVLAQAQALGWPPERVHFELFAAPAMVEGDHAFEIVLEQSGRTLTVPADKSILDVLIDAGCDPLFDCKRGECGVCAVAVLDGEIEHRDYVLSAREKSLGNVMHTCVSRAKGSRLVLDL